MKKLFLLLCCLVVAFTAMASKNLYCVEGASVLNVRAKSSTSAPILGTLKEGERVEVSWVDEGGWAEILYQGDFGYVSAKYIRKLDRKEASKLDLSGIECVEGGFFAKLEYIEDRLDKAELHTNWTLFIIIPLIILLFLFRGEWPEHYWLYAIAMFVLVLFEAYYSLGANAFGWQGLRIPFQWESFVVSFWDEMGRLVLVLVIDVIYVILIAMQCCTYFIASFLRHGILSIVTMLALFLMAALDCEDEVVLCVVALLVVLLFIKEMLKSYIPLLPRMIGAFIYPLVYVVITIGMLAATVSALSMALSLILEIIIGLVIVAVLLGMGRGVPTIYVPGEGHQTGHGYHGGDMFHGDNGRTYKYDKGTWRPD